MPPFLDCYQIHSRALRGVGSVDCQGNVPSGLSMEKHESFGVVVYAKVVLKLCKGICPHLDIKTPLRREK